MGPRSRDVLQSLTEHDVSNAGFPFGRLKRIADGRRACAGAARDLCRRARLGAACAGRVCRERLRRADGAGQPLGIANAGYRAIELLRLEKGYRAWGAEIGPDHSPLVAGLGWAVKLRSGAPFQGRAALEPRPQSRCRDCSPGSRPIRDRAAWARDHLSRRQARRLAHQRRLRLHGRRRSATATFAIRSRCRSRQGLSGRYELEVAGPRAG